MLEAYNLERDAPNSLFRKEYFEEHHTDWSFPRGMAAGTWLAWIVAPKPVILRLEDIKEKRFRSLDTFSQTILQRLLQTRELQNYHAAVREKLREDTYTNNSLIQKYLGDIASGTVKPADGASGLSLNLLSIQRYCLNREKVSLLIGIFLRFCGFLAYYAESSFTYKGRISKKVLKASGRNSLPLS